jgi:hypothetical protein
MVIHGVSNSGVCSLTGKEGEVIDVSFKDGTLANGSLSFKGLVQLLRMKLVQAKPALAATPVASIAALAK